MSKLLTIFSVGAILVFTSGCGNTKQPDNNTAPTDFTARRNVSTTPFGADFPIGTTTDLAIGKKVMVVGSAGSDGIVSAAQIVVGEFNFGMGFDGARFATDTPTGQQRQRPNFNGQGGGGQGGGNFAGRAGDSRGMTRVVGEIIKMDNTSLVVKTNDGGSKIVFYSANVKILLPPIAITPVKTASTTP
ncbi:MAG: hypothetical protein A3J93_03930 [Candidatus Magasanikbacteria bacterium RIFOXYC2_FULL_42_28]|uniref:DUF5666 domain-containing protein n=1 Tax=Candidatus Magasanikbacteria bacterium RIFOXYC2_FULL_42_28 TaxID=1798704 RepID=A0A1F6NUU7_9BACT|nr:MAG: hypothetical protein A3J93_03930 [Candidatus Magasanikbacteria bacterium RIFOXYC2_FULL_42_28]